jgi:2-keto-3-deoxy-L-rhamnonate aldolase RhmA
MWILLIFQTGALDAGAHGVLVPLLYTAEDAVKLVKSAKFPPMGQRGFGSPFPMEKFHPDLGQTDYLKQANDALLTIVCGDSHIIQLPMSSPVKHSSADF